MRNYARNLETGELVFFTDEIPMPPWEHHRFAFFRCPTSELPSKFRGHLVAECDWQRCERHDHSDKSCHICRDTYTYNRDKRKR